ncbi:MAG TPA: thermonuclease family protein [Xanthobacteraceae bacterium]|nr:thermonuclease family protein [Xanthobacteraceae bacterium]
MAMRRRCAMWTGRRLPDGRPRWLLAPVILASFASGAAAQAQKTRVPPTPSACHVEPFGSGVVARVVDGRTFVLADGREVRLAGIEVPPEADLTIRPEAPATEGASAQAPPSPDRGRAATEALAALVAGQETVLKRAKPVTDRYGRLLADAYVSRDGAEGSVAKTLLAQGLARVAARPGDAACPAELRAAERAARTGRLGLWADPRYFSHAAENPGEIAAERGRFTLVEGKVVSVRESGGTIYVNFGRRWSEDFTVTISKRHERIFAAAGLEPQKLSGRRVVVRGWVEERGGPWIEASTPEQIEIVADK